MEKPATPQTFDDHRLEEKIISEINRTFFGVDLELIRILDLQWKRVLPEVDDLPYDFEYSDQFSPHILFTTRCLVRSEGQLLFMSDAYLYLEASLATVGDSLQATPDYFADLESEELDLTKALPTEVSEALVTLGNGEHSEAIAKLVSDHEDPDAFIASIMDESVRRLFQQQRENLRRDYE